MFDWVLSNKGKRAKRKGPTAARPPYEKARAIAEKGSMDERCDLASNENAQPEILYYFATDDDWQVRRCVAGNDGTPLQADLILAEDPHDDVRCELAAKIAGLMPTLTEDESVKLTEMALEVLDILAADHLPKVRAIVADELKHASNVPEPLVKRLAEDLEEIVSVPILEYSPLLRDDDLIQLIARSIKARALVAISRRRSLTEKVSDAVVAAEQPDAVKSLLENQTAKISDTSMEAIIEKAELNEDWHNAMVYRDDLPIRMIIRIGSFVSAALTEALIERHSNQKSLVTKLRKKVRERIQRGELDEDEMPLDSAESRAEKMHKEGKLDETSLRKALEQQDNAFVRHGVRLLAGLPLETVNMMLNSNSGKAVTALAWKAGLTMDMAESLQHRIARVRSETLVKALPDGGYPLSEEDIEWYVESFFS